jgi:hypothetical protein
MAFRLENILWFDAIFILMIGIYGISTGTGGPQLSQIQTIPAPTLSPLPSATNCAAWDFVCIGINSNALAQATAYIGWAIVNLPVILIYFLSETILFLSIVETTAFSPAFSSNGVPIIGLIFNFLQLFVALDVIRIFRGIGATGF